ncbi:MAG: HAD family hydrolase [Acidimicrobiales bacterium]
MPVPPDVIAFDDVPTLFSLASLEPLLADAGATSPAADAWLRRVLADGFALTAAGDYKSFSDLAGATLAEMLPDACDEARQAVLDGLAELEPYVDSAPAMARGMQGAGVIVVTNDSLAGTRLLLERSGLDAFCQDVVSAEQVQAWRPAPAPYLDAASVADVAGPRLALVSAHPWDVHGARRARLVTGWCNRDGRTFPSSFEPADVEGPELLSVVEALLSL